MRGPCSGFWVYHVAIFHDAGAWVRTLGAAGVAFFFVHTSLVLMQSLDRQTQERVFVPFVVRRFFRICPVAVLVTSAVIVFHIPQTMIHRHMISWNYTLLDVISNLTLAQNFVVPFTSIVPPAWSLSYEVQMYLLLPALYLMIRNGTRGRVIAFYTGF